MTEDLNDSIVDLGRKVVTWVVNTRACDRELDRPTSDELCRLVDVVTTILSRERGCLVLEGEHCVIGDIHGNIDGLMRIFETAGYPPKRSYLFLGDYVDRGQNSCEVILLLYGLKAMWPTHVSLLRGNHEFAIMNQTYGFQYECVQRFSVDLYHKIIASFNELPLVAILADIFCVHGGISSRLQSHKDVLSISKRCDELGDNTWTDLLWSDPSSEIDSYETSPRGCGRLYGMDAVLDFMEDIDVCSRVIRSHESCA
jgi:diadenosine tetraphosphatase ApaH/serine/threonine PP2A family protein phosphatase